MNIIDSVIKAISPKWALSREVAKKQLKAYYDATTSSNYRKNRSKKGTADDAVNGNIASMRDLARELDRNHDMAKGVLNTMVSRIVGSQIIPQPLIKDVNGQLNVDLNREVSKLFVKWAYRPDVTKTMSWGKAARLACRTWLRDGEMLTKHLLGNIQGLNHSTNTSYSIELIEPDILPADYEDTSKNIKGGIKFNQWGEPKRYYLLKNIDSYRTSIRHYSDKDLRSVDADKITHLAIKDRLHQSRGMSIFAAVFTRIDDIKDYEESERIAARVAAAMTAFIKRDPTTAIFQQSDSETTRNYEMAPGIIYDDLLPGEEPVSMQSNRPSGLLSDFRNAMLKMVSSGTGAGYSSISKNYDGTYSSQRQEMVEQKGYYDILIEEFNNSWTKPIWINFIDALTVEIDIPDSIDIDTLYDVHFQNPVIPWIDPQKEANANRELNKLGVKTRSQIIRELNGNPADVMEEVLKENEKMGIADAPIINEEFNSADE